MSRNQPEQLSIRINAFLNRQKATDAEREIYGILYELEEAVPMAEILPLYKDGKRHRMTVQHTLKRMISKGIVTMDKMREYSPVKPSANKTIY